MISISQGQKLRKKGYNLVTNRNFTKVIRYSKNELFQGKNEKLWKALTTWVYSVEDQERAEVKRRKIWSNK